MEDAFAKSQQRTEAMYEALQIEPDDTVMLGDSLTEEAPWVELLPDLSVKNRGIGGQTSDEIFERLDPIIAGNPQTIALMVGTNDLANGDSPDKVLATLDSIIARIASEIPRTQLIIQSLLPREPELRPRIEQVNAGLKRLCAARQLTYVDLYPDFVGEDGGIDRQLSNDRIHLLPEGYAQWVKKLRPHIDAGNSSASKPPDPTGT